MISIVGGFDMSLERLGVRGPRPERRFRQHQDAISGWRLIAGLLLTPAPLRRATTNSRGDTESRLASSTPPLYYNVNSNTPSSGIPAD